MHNFRSTRQQRLQKEEITRNRSDNVVPLHYEDRSNPQP